VQSQQFSGFCADNAVKNDHRRIFAIDWPRDSSFIAPKVRPTDNPTRVGKMAISRVFYAIS